MWPDVTIRRRVDWLSTHCVCVCVFVWRIAVWLMHFASEHWVGLNPCRSFVPEEFSVNKHPLCFPCHLVIHAFIGFIHVNNDLDQEMHGTWMPSASQCNSSMSSDRHTSLKCTHVCYMWKMCLYRACPGFFVCVTFGNFTVLVIKVVFDFQQLCFSWAYACYAGRHMHGDPVDWVSTEILANPDSAC